MGKQTIHEEVIELLPWFINESLSDRERELVMAHLADCADCRQERDHLQSVEKLIVEEDVPVPSYQFSYRKLASRIEEAERNRESTEILESRRARANWMAIAGVAATLFAGVLTVAWFQNPEELGEFRTLSTTSPDNGQLHRIQLTFEQPIQAQTLRQALIDTRSNIISGPSNDGTYLVEMNVPQGVPDADFLKTIQQIEGVALARFEQ